MYTLRKLSNEEKLKHELKRALEEMYPTESIDVENLTLSLGEPRTDNVLEFNLRFYARYYERITTIPLTHLTIRKSLINKIKEDQEKHGFKEFETMIADVLEKHYDSI